MICILLQLEEICKMQAPFAKHSPVQTHKIPSLQEAVACPRSPLLISIFLRYEHTIVRRKYSISLLLSGIFTFHFLESIIWYIESAVFIININIIIIIILKSLETSSWLGSGASDSRSQGCGFEPHAECGAKFKKRRENRGVLTSALWLMHPVSWEDSGSYVMFFFYSRHCLWFQILSFGLWCIQAYGFSM